MEDQFSRADLPPIRLATTGAESTAPEYPPATIPTVTTLQARYLLEWGYTPALMKSLQDAGAGSGTCRGFARRTSPDSASGPAVVSILSFLWPGLGHKYLSHRRRAVLFAFPPLVLIAGLAYAIVQSPQVFAVRLLAPSFGYIVVALLALHAAWRVAALMDAWRLSRLEDRGRSSFVLALALSLVVVATHAIAGAYIHSFSSAAAPIFGTADDLVDRLETDTEPGVDVAPPTHDRPMPAGAPPQEYPSLSDEYDGRLTVLIVGVDSAPGRGQALTDTLIVASYEMDTGLVTMISIPRDVGRMPIYNGAEYRGKINGFLTYARSNPDLYPDGPLPALVRQVGHLLGVDIDYYAATDMAGLEQLVDMVGGVTVILERPIRDHFWDFHLEPGEYHLDGATAMIYVRSRFGRGNSDFERARRQQDVIRALTQRGRDPAVLARLPQVLAAAAEMVRTDVPPDRIPDFLAMLDQVVEAEVRQIVLRPTTYAQRVPPEETGGAYMIELKMEEVRQLSLELFGAGSHYNEERYPQEHDQHIDVR